MQVPLRVVIVCNDLNGAQRLNDLNVLNRLRSYVSEEVERLEALERTDPHDERSACPEQSRRIEPFECLRAAVLVRKGYSVRPTLVGPLFRHFRNCENVEVSLPVFNPINDWNVWKKA